VTGELSLSIRATGSAVEDALEGLRSGDGSGASDPVQRWRDVWRERVVVMDRLVDYADSLVALQKASANAGAAARSVADKLAGLAEAAGVVDPTTGVSSAAGLAADAAAFVWKQIAVARAGSTMRQSVEAAHPAVLRIAEIVAADLLDTRLIVRGAAEQRRGLLEADGEYAGAAGLRAQVEKARAEVLRVELKAWSAKETSRLAELDAVDAAAGRVMQKKGEELRALDASEKAQLALLASTSDAIAAWAAAHGRLLAALRDHRPLSLESLEQAAVELRALIKKVRDQ